MRLRKFLILRRPWSARLEGRTALIQLNVNFLTACFAERQQGRIALNHPNASKHQEQYLRRAENIISGMQALTAGNANLSHPGRPRRRPTHDHASKGRKGPA